MPTRNLVSESDGVRTYNVYDDEGNLIGTDTESRVDQTQVNRATIRQRASVALERNAVFLALAAPTNAQVLAQVKLLTKECNGLIRDMLGDYSSSDDA